MRAEATGELLAPNGALITDVRLSAAWNSRGVGRRRVGDPRMATDEELAEPVVFIL
ncbi:MAG TPA: hypothetical protein VFX15_14045 [Actinomycetes bacterium]|nr:hypothetical protein [Actinomycetes bacterium]